jgi:phosphoenolpyruvate-protein phosphotransferase (PTS system enzyme I)
MMIPGDRVSERRLTGIPAAEGVAAGPVHLLVGALVVEQREIAREEIATELLRLDRALDATEEHFTVLAESLEAAGRHAAVEIVTAYRLMLRSPEIAGEARRLVVDLAHGADWAVRQATDQTRATFEAMEDPYLRERGRDVQAVGEQLLRALLGLPAVRAGHGEVAGGIAVAFDLSPLEVARLHADGAIGLVTETGGRSSHAAILARSYGIPFVAGVVNISAELRAADQLVLDGKRGLVVINPDRHTTDELHRVHLRSVRRQHKMAALHALPATTLDGVSVALQANIESLGQISRALSFGAQGIGLFRTEFLYLDRTDLPSEEEQFRDACAALAALDGRPATFRTLDLGGDKLPPSVRIAEGHNPALGVRAIRFSLRRPDIFRTQLRALYRAAARGPMRVMFPLISGLADLREALHIAQAVKAELARAGVLHDPAVQTGVMIETPSAAITADHLARHCDFLSIGTNDLIQYAFAADRDNRDVDHLYHPLHPAVLRLIKLALEGAAAAAKPISLCGDMAAEPLYAQTLLGLGLRDYSMTATAIPSVKTALRASHLVDAQALAAEALTLEREGDVEELAARALAQAVPVDSADSPQQPITH